MSEHAFDDRDMPGYFLPEDSQFRLVKLSDYIKFLERLAQPRSAREKHEAIPEVRMDELAFCMELLAEQVDLVLDEVSWPARRTDRKSKAERDDAEEDESEEAVEEEPDEKASAVDFAFGLTMDQFDTLNCLVQTISAHGDVVSVSDTATFAKHTLPQTGHAIFGATEIMQGLLNQIEAQPLRNDARRRSGVSEERAVYAVTRGESSHSVPMH
ncbi:XAC0095 family protein [[Pseudomonas] boreopolis]|uniref:XAC0095-like domain-containing protein n=1 Tax=Xanthomonas boreopolis TaxID=86183 RepID=A0A919FAX2_9XANT|nr:hypothetical protein GCM10009090_33150 [[Pseudomonas] boreopolis]